MIRRPIASATLASLVLAGFGCSMLKSGSGHGFGQGSYSYSATASVGDFVTVEVDERDHTITYDNQSTGETGVAAFHVASDGTYVIDSDSGTMAPTMAYEVPGYAFIMAANHTGADGIPSILTAVHTQSISVSDLAGAYNYMQFRTNSGGVEIGDVHIDASSILPSSYSPGQGGSHYHSSTMDVGAVVEHGTYLTNPDTDGQGNPTGDDTIFRTTDGFFAVDTPNGGLVCLQKAESKDFDTTCIGHYHAMIFGKTGATTGVGNVETPAAGSLAKYAIIVSNGGSAGSPVANIVVNDVSGHSVKLASQDFTALDDDAALHAGIGQDCPGAFTATAGGTQYFVIFMVDSLMIAAYKDNGGGVYDYWYGVGLRDDTSGG